MIDKIEQEVQKLKSFGFIRKEQHLEWLANIILVTKKNGQIRVCINYRDLNGACPKDEFLLAILQVMIDNTCGFKQMIFMDGFSSYSQIKMHLEDEKQTSFQAIITLSFHLVWKMLALHIKGLWWSYSKICNTRWSNVMLIILSSKVEEKKTILKIFEKFSSNSANTNYEWIL